MAAPYCAVMELVRQVVVFDAADLQAESAFWAGLLGGHVFQDDDWHSVIDAAGEWRIGVQLAPNHVPPSWPHGAPQQVHLDLHVDDPRTAHRDAMALGARLLQAAPDLGAAEGHQVYADPAGHPFCIGWGQPSREQLARFVAATLPAAPSTVRPEPAGIDTEHMKSAAAVARADQRITVEIGLRQRAAQQADAVGDARATAGVLADFTRQVGRSPSGLDEEPDRTATLALIERARFLDPGDDPRCALRSLWRRRGTASRRPPSRMRRWRPRHCCWPWPWLGHGWPLDLLLSGGRH